MLEVLTKGDNVKQVEPNLYTRDTLAMELHSILYKNKDLRYQDNIMSTLADFQEIVLQLGELNISGMIEDSNLKNRFMEIVALYFSMVNSVNGILHKKNTHKLSLHILSMRILNTVKGLQNQPRSITINNTKIYMDSSKGTLLTLTTLLTHYIFKIHSNPVIVSGTYYSAEESEQVMNSCTEIISLLIIIWNQYFDGKMSVNTFIDEINNYVK